MIEDDPLLAAAGGGLTIRYRNRFLYSPRAPREGAVRRVELAIRRGEIRERSLLFVPSAGLGYGLPELLQSLPAGCHVLCVETDQKLMALAAGTPPAGAAPPAISPPMRSRAARPENEDRVGQAAPAPPFPRDPRLTVVRAGGPEGALQALHALGVWRFRRVVPIALCGGYDLDRPAYDAIRQALEGEIRLFWQNKMTLIRLGRLWVRNLFENLALLPQAGDLEGLRTDRPVLVAGAGPSLDGALGWIRAARGLLRLACVDTALPVLREAGLRPDMVFVLEAQAANAQDFLGWGEPPACLPGTPLVCDLTVHPSLARRFAADLRFFASRFAPLRLLDRLEAAGLLPRAIPPLGSVGVAAVHLCLELTRGPVLLAGLDFSYPGGRTHARGAPAQRRDHAASGRLAPAGQAAWEGLLGRPRLRRRDRGGRPLLTDLVLESYADQLARRIREEGRVFDLGREGLPLGAAPVESLADLERVCSSAPPPRPAYRRPPPLGEGGAEAVRRFLAGELAGLEELAGMLRRRLGGASGGAAGADAGDEALRERIGELDYLYLHFPEADPRPSLERGFLARLLLSAEDFRRRLSRLAAGPGAGGG